MDNDLAHAIALLNEEEAIEIVRRKLNSGISPLSILDEAGRGMEMVSAYYSKGEYFLPELVHSGDILKSITEMIKQKITKENPMKVRGKIIIGTVAGDIHDLGKDILIYMLDASGFEVIDLGVNVPAQIFVEKIKESGVTIVMLSGLLTLAHESMRTTIEAIRNAGLRDKVKIIVGGGQMSENVVKYTGADAHGKDAIEAVTLAKKWS